MLNLMILGAGGFGREVYAWAQQAEGFGKDWVLKGFLDAGRDALEKRPGPGVMVGSISDHQPKQDEVFICAIGTPAIKKRCSELIASRGGKFISIVHRTAIVGHSVRIGAGGILCPGAIVSFNVTLGQGVALNLHATVNHDAVVGAWSQLNCHSDVMGGVHLEEEVFLGSHASILPGVKVGRGAIVGAGAVVRSEV